jgi:hypothetical protein
MYENMAKLKRVMRLHTQEEQDEGKQAGQRLDDRHGRHDVAMAQWT